LEALIPTRLFCAGIKGIGTVRRILSDFHASLRDSHPVPAIAAAIIFAVLAIALAINMNGL